MYGQGQHTRAVIDGDRGEGAPGRQHVGVATTQLARAEEDRAIAARDAAAAGHRPMMASG
ncbi:MAG: hypothetical protein V4537_15880 [Pseudomonadota bacterium]